MKICIFALLTIMLAVAVAQFFSYVGKNKVSSPKEDYRISVILHQPDVSQYWNNIWRSIYGMSEEFPVSISPYQYRARSDIETKFQTALLAEPDGIIFCAPQEVSSEFQSMLRQARSNGIALVCVDTDAGAEYRDVFIGVDNTEYGKILAGEIAERVDDDQRILFLNYYNTSSPTIGLRQEVFLSQIDVLGYGDKVETFDFLFSDRTGENITDLQVILTGEESPDYVVAFGPAATQPAASILQKLEKDHIGVFGCGEDKELIQCVEDGIINLLLAQDSYLIGRSSVESVLSILEGQPYESEIFCDLIHITPDNVENNGLAQIIKEAE